MNKITATLIITGGAVSATAITIHAIRSHRQERAIDRELEENLNLDLAAIKAASERVAKMITEGRYRGKSLALIAEDFEEALKFETIAIRN